MHYTLLDWGKRSALTSALHRIHMGKLLDEHRIANIGRGIQGLLDARLLCTHVGLAQPWPYHGGRHMGSHDLPCPCPTCHPLSTRLSHLPQYTAQSSWGVSFTDVVMAPPIPQQKHDEHMEMCILPSPSTKSSG